MSLFRIGTYTDVDGRVNTVTVDVKLVRMTGAFTTTDHDTIEHPLYLSIVGDVRGPGRSTVTTGQCVDEVQRVTRFDPAWDTERAASLVEVWHRWHLNDMRPGCAHQTPIGDTPGERLDRTPACEQTGYRWGSAWLVEPLPAEVIDWAHGLGVAIKEPTGAR